MKDPPDRNIFTINSQIPLSIGIDNAKSLQWTTPGPRYLVISRTNSTDTLANVSPFLIKKVIDNVCGGEVSQCKKLRNGTILVKTKNVKQAMSLMKLISLTPSITIDVTEHKFLNTCKGVVYCNALRGIEESEILEELKSQSVIEVNKIFKKVNGVLQETGLVVFKFAQSSLPDYIYVGYEKINIRTYIPMPLRCNKCLRFGHLAKFCENMKTCCNCAKTHELEEEYEICINEMNCINCDNANNPAKRHHCKDRVCPVFVYEKELQTISTLEKVNRKTAEKIHKQRNSTTPSYANAAKSHNQPQPTTIQTPNNSTSPPERPLIRYDDITYTTSTNMQQSNPESIRNSSATPKDEVLITDLVNLDSASSSSKVNKIKILPRSISKRQLSIIKKDKKDKKFKPRKDNIDTETLSEDSNMEMKT